MLKKLFVMLVIIVSFTNTSFALEVEPNPEIHKIIGGLYALTAAINLNGSVNPTVEQISRYFTSAPYPDKTWAESVKISRVKNSLWVGILVNKFSNARSYLRANANELRIKDNPNGNSWLGGDFVWLKAAEVSDKLKPVQILSSTGTGDDKAIIFLSYEKKNLWWQTNPAFTPQASKNLLKLSGVKKQPELHAPKKEFVSIYDEVKPASVHVPGKIYVSSDKTFREEFDTSIGGVNFNPIPHVRY